MDEVILRLLMDLGVFCSIGMHRCFNRQHWGGRFTSTPMGDERVGVPHSYCTYSESAWGGS